MSDEKKITRARNKTVMLTPEMTSQMRNSMSKNLADLDDNASSEWISRPSASNATSDGWERPKFEAKETPAQQATVNLNQFQSNQLEHDPLDFRNFGSSNDVPVNTPENVEDSWQAFTETVIEPIEMEPVTHFGSFQPEFEPMHPQVETPIIEPEIPAYFQAAVPTPPPVAAPIAAPVAAPVQQEFVAPPVHVQESKTGNRLTWELETPVIGFLVSYDENKNGEFYPLRIGRLAVTSVDPGNGNHLILKHSTVSEMHAILKITANARVQILDQLSEFGTKILKAGTDECLELSGDKSELKHGDVVIFGERQFSVCIIDFGV